MSDLKDLLAPISRMVATLPLDDAAAAERALEAAFPAQGPAVAAITAAAKAALAAGTICNKGEGAMKFSRLAKPEQDPGKCSIDAVSMTSVAGPFHTHVKGEVCLCIPDSNTVTFEGRNATWMVLPVGSRHAPTVVGGHMLILYWWPDGAVAWG
jgi:hypothetical protein